MEITWTPQAVESYDKVIDNSLEHFGRFATIDLTKKVDAAIDKIKKHPKAAPLIPIISNNTYRAISLKGPLQLVYKEGEDICTIMAVWNTRMNPNRLTKILK